MDQNIGIGRSYEAFAPARDARKALRPGRGIEELMNLNVCSLNESFYSHVAGWEDGTSRFAALVRAQLNKGCRILDLGSGQGKTGPVNFRGQVAAVVGLDPDEAVASNAMVDHCVRGVAQQLPFRGNSFDVVFSDWVIEHLPEPDATASEIKRVLAVGGCFVFRTGNTRHYSYAIAKHTPHWFHQLVANRARGLPPDSGDTYLTYYRMNTVACVRRTMGRAGFREKALFTVEAEPSYLMFSVPTFLLGVGYERIVNRYAALAGLRACIFGCFVKP
ncbi:MAG TPA: class I SAM-dependent methyltransferase [Candidatus Binataceae bacterium]|nr:class I SAM-dependent methyltransferase [Candidatus Binataceae bacterium]